MLRAHCQAYTPKAWYSILQYRAHLVIRTGHRILAEKSCFQVCVPKVCGPIVVS